MHNQKTSRTKILYGPAINISERRISALWQVSVNFIIEPAKKTEPIRSISSSKFPGKLDIEDRNRVIFKAQGRKADFKLCCDGSKLDNARIGAAIVWKKDSIIEEWQERKVALGSNKKIFDAEMWGISEAFKIAE